jgi:hypothetical protein
MVEKIRSRRSASDPDQSFVPLGVLRLKEFLLSFGIVSTGREDLRVWEEEWR